MEATNNDILFRKSMTFCAWSGFMAIFFFIIGGMLLGGMLPPLLHANDSPDMFVSKVTEHLFSIRIGSVFLMISFALFGPFGAGIAAQTRRVESRPVFSYVQLMFTACGTMVALLVAFTWALMVFRPTEYHPSTVQMFADFAYFLAVFSVPVFGGWCAIIAMSILFSEEGKEPFPRWVAYINLWAVLLFAPGQMVLFFKDGPFSWHGIVALWIPFVAFFLWILIMSVEMLKAAKKAD
ncbi:hypothetical protein IMCC21906_01620 [Spongiibacter sp. IMCC21906]|uniref:hypothetical protein n=1 Tax=Spongiibacter sp. IMCC21906 TaxID=1620392 RepID=UPI00062DEF37|nr:hypothetical protein [Spongiibacter sp. IMCC21906]AKH69297.1 hypothetical protein IMCC21906_01620 [Spongiibacter sp. IMCC21906]